MQSTEILQVNDLTYKWETTNFALRHLQIKFFPGKSFFHYCPSGKESTSLHEANSSFFGNQTDHIHYFSANLAIPLAKSLMMKTIVDTYLDETGKIDKSNVDFQVFIYEHDKDEKKTLDDLRKGFELLSPYSSLLQEVVVTYGKGSIKHVKFNLSGELDTIKQMLHEGEKDIGTTAKWYSMYAYNIMEKIKQRKNDYNGKMTIPAYESNLILELTELELSDIVEAQI